MYHKKRNTVDFFLEISFGPYQSEIYKRYFKNVSFFIKHIKDMNMQVHVHNLNISIKCLQKYVHTLFSVYF